MQIHRQASSFAINSEATAASEELMKMVFGFMASQAISVVARLGIADLVENGAKNADELAQATGADARSIYRLMRALTNVGVFIEDDERRFSSTPMSQLLRKNAPDSIGGFSTFFCSDWHWLVWGHLDYSVRTGKPAFEKIYQKPFFDYLEDHPLPAQIFNNGMTSFSAHTGNAVVEAYDFSGIHTLTDVGGGHGYLLASILKRYPDMQGILFDAPSVVQGAQSVIGAEDIGKRIACVGGNFFEPIKVQTDAIIMKHIIHDWDDENSLKILRNCSESLKPGGKLLVVEMVIPGPNQPSIGKFLDLQMLVFLHSYERTEKEYAALLEQAGFRLTGIFPSASPFSVIEAVRV